MDNIPEGLCHCCGKPAFVEGENYVITETGCWEWLGNLTHNGYGRIVYRHRRYPAHRLSYILVYGAVPDNHHVHHVCENQACINPDHLESVLNRDHFNGHRSPEWYAKREYKNASRSVDDNTVRAIRDLWATGDYTVDNLSAMFPAISRAHVHRIATYQRRKLVT